MPKIYQGWVVVTAACAVLTFAYGLHYSYGVFLPHMVADLGSDRATLSAPFSIYVLVFSVCSYFSGRITDRHGPQRVLIFAAVLLTLAYILLSQVNAPWQVFLIFIIIAGPGMGSVYIPMNAAVSKWFNARRGLALSLLGCGVSLAALVGPLAITAFISIWGWRGALVASGLATGALILTASFFMPAKPPGSAPRPIDRRLNPLPSVGISEDWSLSEAMHTPAFWLLLTVFFLTWTVVFLPFVHMPGYALDLNIAPTWAAVLVGALGIGGLVGRLVIGWIADRIGILTALSVTLVVQVLGFIALIYAHDLVWLLAASAFLGIGAGSTSVLFNALVPRIFGQSHVGSISGFLFAIAGAAASIGPYLAGYLRDLTGSYDSSFWFSAAVNFAALLFVGFIAKPQKSPAQESREA